MIFFKNIQNKRLNRYKSLLEKYKFVNKENENKHQYSIKNCMDGNKKIVVSVNNEQEWNEVGTLFCDKGKLQFCGNSKFTDPSLIVNWEHVKNQKEVKLCGWYYDGILVYIEKAYWERYDQPVTYITANEFIEANSYNYLRLSLCATKQSIFSYKSNNGIKTSK